MRIAVAAPFIKRVHGNRLAFCLARELARRHDVTVVAETVLDRIVPEVRQQVAPAHFEFVRTTPSDRWSNLDLLSRQLLRGPDRRLASLLRRLHRSAPIDWVVVFSDEGHWVGEYLNRGADAARPRTALVLLDLIDHVFLLARDRPHSVLRRAVISVYPFIHRVEARRIRAFDRVFSISRWGAELSSYLYGLGPTESLAAVDDERFSPPATVDDATPYIAAPTVSLRPTDEGLLRDLRARGVPVLTFGPRAVPGIPHRGFLSDPELVSFLAGARATLFLFDYEGLGLLPLESLSVGTPVITLPSGAPFVELRENPYVRFGVSPEELAHLCLESLGQPRSRRQPDRIRESVHGYFAADVARRLERWLSADPHSVMPPT